jgi:hypothetical protein
MLGNACCVSKITRIVLTKPSEDSFIFARQSAEHLLMVYMTLAEGKINFSRDVALCQRIL